MTFLILFIFGIALGSFLNVVTMRYEEDFTKFDKTKHENLGDFVILTDTRVPRSFKRS